MIYHEDYYPKPIGTVWYNGSVYLRLRHNPLMDALENVVATTKALRGTLDIEEMYDLVLATVTLID